MYPRLFLCALMTLLVFASLAVAGDEHLPRMLDALEGYEADHLVDKHATSGQVTPKTVMEQFNLHIQHKKMACVKAIGHEEFCHCISENMPSDQEFANYVVAVSKTREELNYDRLSEYYKHSIDLARTARDKCVMETM